MLTYTIKEIKKDQEEAEGSHDPLLTRAWANFQFQNPVAEEKPGCYDEEPWNTTI